MRTRPSILLLVLFFAASAFKIQAQGTDYLNMDEAVLTMNKETKKSLRAQSMPMLLWLPGGSKFSYVEIGTPSKLVITEAENNKVDSSINLDILNAAIKTYNPKYSLKSFPLIEWIDNDNFRIFKEHELDLKRGLSPDLLFWKCHYK
jgi:hypothetical protein